MHRASLTLFNDVPLNQKGVSAIDFTVCPRKNITLKQWNAASKFWDV